MIALLAVFASVRASNGVVDVDQAVYESTLRGMRSGEGYYEAHRDALIDKEGVPPSSLRAVRPPTMFLFLSIFPEAAWRYVAGIAYLGILLAAWRLGEPHGRYGGLTAVLLTGLWVFAASSFLFLHAELWGAPLLLWGAVSVRRGKDPRAAAFLAGASAVRELFGIALIAGAILRRRTPLPWILALLGIAAFGVAHASFAKPILADAGSQVALGNEPFSLNLALTILSPGDNAVSWLCGVMMLALGIRGLLLAKARDDGAALLLPFVGVMAIASLVATRTYWSLTWGPAVAAFSAAGALGFRGRTSEDGGVARPEDPATPKAPDR